MRTKNNEHPEWATVTQAAKVRGVTPQTVTLAIRRGELPAETVGAFYIISRAALAAWQPAGKRGADSADP